MKIKKLFHYNENAYRDLGKYLHREGSLPSILNFGLNCAYGFGRRLIIRRYRRKKFRVKKSIKIIKHKIKFPVCDHPVVSIIIPVFNQYKYTLNCLNSIRRSKDKTPYEIIIADDFSTDKTKTLDKMVKGVTILHNTSNLGYIRNCNNAAKYAKGSYLYFLNNDTKVGKHWLEHLVRVFSLRQNVGVVGSLLIRPDGFTQECGGYIFKNFIQTYAFNSPNDPKFNYLKKCDYVSGSSLLTPKQLFNRIGGFDTRFVPAYSDDLDYCITAAKLGYSVYVQPKAKIVHYENISYNEESTNLMAKNYEKLKEKHKGFLKTRTFFSKAKEETGKKRLPVLLFIDDLFPQYDKHAGGKSTYDLLKVLSNMKLNVKFCPLFAYGIEEKYYSLLNDLGIETIPQNKINDWIEEHYGLVDYIFLSRPNVAQNFMIKALRYRNIKVLYYGHDLHFFRMKRGQKYDSTIIDNEINKMKQIEKTIISSCDTAYYPSSEETKLLHDKYKFTNVKTIPLYALDIEKMPRHCDFDNSSGIIFVGSSHSPNLDGITWFIDKIFPTIVKRIPSIKLYIVGKKINLSFKTKNRRNIKIMGRMSNDELDDLYAKTKIAIAPLRYGAGAKGKVVDALYHKTPVIATSCGAEGFDVSNPIITVANNELDFANKLSELYLNKEKWESLNPSYKKFISKYYSPKNLINVFIKDIDVAPRLNEENIL